MQRIHFIAIGGAIMHQLAISLQRKGNTVTGSDDDIADPATKQSEAGRTITRVLWLASRKTHYSINFFSEFFGMPAIGLW